LGNFRNITALNLEDVLNKLITAFCLAACAVSVSAAEPGNVASQCVVGSVKLSWKPVKRCIVFDNEAKFKATLDAWGWGTQAMPAINWSKEVAVVDSGNNPYGNAVAGCNEIHADTGKKTLTLRWGWQQKVEPSSVSRAKTNKAPDTNAQDKPIMDKAKESVTNVATDAKQTMKDIVDDSKKFGSPIPKRAAVIGVFAKELLSTKPTVDCVVGK
jgi:hypothetical protein